MYQNHESKLNTKVIQFKQASFRRLSLYRGYEIFLQGAFFFITFEVTSHLENVPRRKWVASRALTTKGERSLKRFSLDNSIVLYSFVLQF